MSTTSTLIVGALWVVVPFAIAAKRIKQENRRKDR